MNSSRKLSITTVINASAAVTLLEQRPEKNSGSERDSNPRPLQYRCSALPSHMRAVVYGLARYMGTFSLGPSTVKMKVICPIVATE